MILCEEKKNQKQILKILLDSQKSLVINITKNKSHFLYVLIDKTL